MAGRYYARALEPQDAGLLQGLDRRYALHYGLEPVLSKAGLSFYSRSGHSFVAETRGDARDTSARGFVLAQSVWNGTRPVVRVMRLAVSNLGDMPGRLALLEAVVKSAYDAAIYDVQIEVSPEDEAAAAAIEDKLFLPAKLAVYRRVLGSRGETPGG